MPLKILYFAWIKEKVGIGQELLSPPDEIESARELMSWLMDQSTAHADAFTDSGQIRVAIDQVHSDLDSSIRGASEVAFFPPVTGG